MSASSQDNVFIANNSLTSSAISTQAGVRPVISLKYSNRVTSGSGTSASPYVIG